MHEVTNQHYDKLKFNIFMYKGILKAYNTK